MSSVAEAGAAYDLTGQGRTLTRNTGMSYTYQNNGLIPYATFAGATGYLYRADESGLDILGTESYYAAIVRGLTMGGWFWVDTFDATSTPYMGKWQNANQQSYLLNNLGAASYSFRVTTDGSTQVAVTSTVTRATGEWIFLIGRFDPSTELAIFVNNQKDTNVAGVPASIFNGNSNFEVGRENVNGTYLDGRACHCFLSSQMIEDSTLTTLWHQTRALFGK